ncbi:MAG TPA: Fe-S cluster protein [Candidatus Omnitrophica bacterium]|nr:Fe-S cluster protein [Candidatus Omnitrophota bacterium]
MDYIKQIRILKILPCIADAEKIRFHAQLDRDISEILSYLNAILDSVIYNHYGKTLTIKKEGRIITLYSYDVQGAKIDDEEDAARILEWLKEKINYCYKNKDKIQPNYQRRQSLTPLDIYRLLPGLNCKQCGETTCFSFAIKLSAEEANKCTAHPFFLLNIRRKEKYCFSY